MYRFSVSVEDFYRTFPPEHARVDACMQELVERYGITGKSVLSVGAGSGEEERRFAPSNDLLLIDIDEQRSILSRIKTLPQKPGLSYWIGDAGELEAELGHYDVVYFSSFTPDEIRRDKILRTNVAAHRQWSMDDEPFHPVVMSYASRLKVDGILLVQSYYGGIDTAYEPHFLGACQLQLHKAGLSLLEVHRFEYFRGVALYTAVKGPPRLPPIKSLSQFHGRAKAERVERIFPSGMVQQAATSKIKRAAQHLRELIRR
jgi:hypothetical protein